LPRLSLEDLFTTFGTNLRSCAAKLLSINGGEEGFYLVDIMDKRYYYCGKSTQDIKSKLLELGIGALTQIHKGVCSWYCRYTTGAPKTDLFIFKS
jgi:hypothetical protein